MVRTEIIRKRLQKLNEYLNFLDCLISHSCEDFDTQPEID